MDIHQNHCKTFPWAVLSNQRERGTMRITREFCSPSPSNLGGVTSDEWTLISHNLMIA